MKTIAWDVDDVLNDLTRAWLAGVWLPSHPERVIRYEDLHENPPHALLGVSKPEYLASLDGFRASEEALRMGPAVAVLGWFAENGGQARHVAITATPLRAAPQSAAWVIRHYGRWIRSFHFLPSPRDGEDLPAYDASKGEALGRMGGADLLIDDNPQNLAAARAAGVPTMEFPRPWNHCPLTVEETLWQLTRWLRE
jgi:hypothetical protein